MYHIRKAKSIKCLLEELENRLIVYVKGNRFQSDLSVASEIKGDFSLYFIMLIGLYLYFLFRSRSFGEGDRR